MKEFLKKLWEKFVNWILSIPQDKRLHFVAGIIIAAFFAIAVEEPLCFFPVIFFAVGKEMLDVFFGGKFDVWDMVATLVGALIPQLFVVLHYWWF